LNYYWKAISGKGFYNDEVIKSVKEKLLKETDTSKWIKDFVSGLSQAFLTVEKIEKSTDSYVKDLFYLKNMALAYPYLIKAYNLNADDKSISRLIKLLENITFRYLLRGDRAEIESRLNYSVVHFTAENLNTQIDDMIHKIKYDGWWGYWSDGQMQSHLDGWFYKNRVDNYFLWKYELYLSTTEHPAPHKVTYSDLISNESIEHIAPQTPTNGNPVENGYGIYDDNENLTDGINSGQWLNRIGNLMLISQKHNSSIGNRPFKQKLESYGKDNLLNQQKKIADYVLDKSNPVWDKNAIEKRRLSKVNLGQYLCSKNRLFICS
jgi:hypothetical protein